MTLVPARVRALLEHRPFPVLLVAATLLLTSPALVGDLVVDDFFTPDGRPLAIRAHFPSPLEADGRRFFVWTGAGVVPFTLPAVGETVTIPSVSILDLMFRKH